MVIEIIKASYIQGYQIAFEFSDGTKQTIDFENFLKQAKNSMSRKYLDKNLFQSFTIKFGDIIWNDYEMCFPIWDLYEGKL